MRTSDRSAAGTTYVAALLDALPDPTAVLDRDGTIALVNDAWRNFSTDNGGTAETTGVGVNYLEVCARSITAGCLDAAVVAAGLRRVLEGETVEVELEYSCPAPAVGRWFLLRITPIDSDAGGLLISHLNITRRKMAELDLERIASHDPLTGLANRARFMERLTSALAARSGRGAASDIGVLYLDLDGFKPVNDTFGHASGDEVLQAVASRLRQVIRPQDTAARLGGDEFVVLAPRITNSGMAGLAYRIQVVLAVPHLIHGQLVEVGASVGSYLAALGEEPADVVDIADGAMYAAKRARTQHG